LRCPTCVAPRIAVWTRRSSRRSFGSSGPSVSASEIFKYASLARVLQGFHVPARVMGRGTEGYGYGSRLADPLARGPVVVVL
jgi:hypothetical protein